MRGDRLLLTGAVCALLLVLATDIVPTLYVVLMSFAPMREVSGDGYRIVVRDPVFAKALVNTVVFAAGVASLQVFGGLVVARSLRGASSAAQAGWFVLLLSPWLMSEMAAVVLWRGILMADVGQVDRWMNALGLPSLRLLAGPATALGSLVLVSVWQGIGFTTLFVLGALVSIPRALYHAASISGLNPWRTFLMLELPLIRTALAASFVAVALQHVSQFALPARLTAGGPMHATTMVGTYLFDRLLSDPNPGAAAAGGSVVLAGIAILCALAWCVRGRLRLAR